jgi:hypothetical protein
MTHCLGEGRMDGLGREWGGEVNDEEVMRWINPVLAKNRFRYWYRDYNL